MIKVAEYVKKEVKYKEEKMATTRHETIEYKKIPFSLLWLFIISC